MSVGPRGANGEDRPRHHHQVVDQPGQLSGQRRRGFGGDTRPGGVLVAAEAHPQHAVGPQPGAGGGQHVGGEPVAVGPLIAPLVGQSRQELPHQRVLPGVDLDAVQARRTGAFGCCPEPGHHCTDVGRLHLLRDLAGVHLRHPRGRPQFTLAPVRGALASRVAQRRQHQRAVRMAGVGDRRPAGDALRGQRRPLVGPVRRVNRRLLGDDDSGTALGSAPVVGDVAVRDRAITTKVGNVWPEHHPVRSAPGTEINWVQQGHRSMIVGGGPGCEQRPIRGPPDRSGQPGTDADRHRCARAAVIL